jgi:ATP adenylyltransferase
MYIFEMYYEDFVNFIEIRMRMSHVYQPVMLMALLKNTGKCSVREIAKTILSHDESQLEYYENVVKNMVGKVLRDHGIVERYDGGYSLIGYENLDEAQVDSLVKLCEDKLDEYKAKRGSDIWKHRRVSGGYIPGTLRYEVLKDARFRCELCGISADARALEVDHIVPRNKGGTDSIDNLQALCYRCNAMKRDRDDTDFRRIAESYERRRTGCVFCETPSNDVVAENELAYAIRDAYPVTPLHTLIVPKRHAQGYFELGRAELNACHRLVELAKRNIDRTYARTISTAGFLSCWTR